MSTLKNSVRLVGNLGTNPEVKSFDQNKKNGQAFFGNQRNL